MDKYPPINQSAVKKSYMYCTDDDEDNGVLDGMFRRPANLSVVPPFEMTDKPRGRRRKLPTVAKMETDEVKKKEETKGETKPPLTGRPKVFIKATKSRWRKGDLEEMNRDSSSYTLNLVTPEKQAVNEPDFIGDAFYYNLTKSTLFPELEGDYVILYTRPVGARFDTQFKSATFSPSTVNKITIVTRQARLQSESARDMQHILAAGHWAAINLAFLGIYATLGCERVPDDAPRSNHNAAPAKIKLATINAVEGANNPLANLVIRDTGNTISFGLKVMENKWDEVAKKVVYSGFHFLKMEMPSYDSDTGVAERQLIVAVKIPRSGEGNVGSSFILKQRQFSYRDIAILESDIRVRELADWRNYAVTEGYDDHAPIPGWRPQSPERLGLKTGGFEPSELEMHLLTVDDPIRELKNLTTWIRDFVTDNPSCNSDYITNDAYRYIESRHKTMRGELELREAVGAEKLLREAKAEDGHGLPGGEGLESKNKSEQGDALGGIGSQRFKGSDKDKPSPFLHSGCGRQDNNKF